MSLLAFPITAPAGGALRTSHIQIDGMRIELLESAGTGSPIFFCHANSSCAAAFAPLFETELGRRHRLIAMSFPGHGGSDRARHPDMYSIPKLGDLAASVITQLGLRSYILVGHSLGGHALLEAADRLDDALGLMLVSAPPLSMAMLEQAFRPDPSDGLLFQGTLDPAQASRLAGCYVADPASVALPALVDGILRTDPLFRPSLLASLKRGDLRDEWQALERGRWPVALFSGAHDRFLYPGYFERVPRERLWRDGPLSFATCGHALHLEAPLQFSQELACFVAELAPRTNGAGLHGGAS